MPSCAERRLQRGELLGVRLRARMLVDARRRRPGRARRRSGRPRWPPPSAAASAARTRPDPRAQTPQRSATFSPVSPIDSSGNISSSRGFGKRQPSVVSHTVWSPRGNAVSGFAMTSGARLIDSTPPATNEVAVAGEHRVAGGRRPPESPDAQSRFTRHARDRLRQPGEQRGHPRDVAVVLARLVRAAEVHVVDRGAVDAGALDGRRDRDAARDRPAGRPTARRRSARSGVRTAERTTARATADDVSGRSRSATGSGNAPRASPRRSSSVTAFATLVSVVLRQLVHVHRRRSDRRRPRRCRGRTGARTRAPRRGCRARTGSPRGAPAETSRERRRRGRGARR